MRICLLLFIIFCSCSVKKQGEDYHVTTQEDLVLRADNHPHGWEKAECFTCHVSTNIHLENRLNHPSFNSARGLVEQYGLMSCRGCHGSNGATP